MRSRAAYVSCFLTPLSLRSSLAQGIIGNNVSSTFQQYTVLNADVTAKASTLACNCFFAKRTQLICAFAQIPDNLSFDQAATVPLGLATAAVGLYHEENKNGSAALYPPWKDGGLGKYTNEPIFILGGASSVGQYGMSLWPTAYTTFSLPTRCACPVIQLARLSGFSPIITTASLHNEAALKELGATYVLDRSLPARTVLSEVKKITDDVPVKTVYDAVSYADTQNLGYDILAPGGTEVIDLPQEINGEKQSADKKVVVVFGNVNVPDNRRLGVNLYAKLTQWLGDGTLRVCGVNSCPAHAAALKRCFPHSLTERRCFLMDCRVSYLVSRNWRKGSATSNS